MHCLLCLLWNSFEPFNKNELVLVKLENLMSTRFSMSLKWLVIYGGTLLMTVILEDIYRRSKLLFSFDRNPVSLHLID
jgi:hypothetical protein